jgi:hypothetical protein
MNSRLLAALVIVQFAAIGCAGTGLADDAECLRPMRS